MRSEFAPGCVFLGLDSLNRKSLYNRVSQRLEDFYAEVDNALQLKSTTHHSSGRLQQKKLGRGETNKNFVERCGLGKRTGSGKGLPTMAEIKKLFAKNSLFIEDLGCPNTPKKHVIDYIMVDEGRILEDASVVLSFGFGGDHHFRV